METNSMVMNGLPAFVYVEIIGSIVGLILTAMLFRVSGSIGGLLGSAIRGLLAGVVLFTFSFVAGAIMDTQEAVDMKTSMVVHMSLMVVAMIIIVYSALKLAKIMNP